MHPPAEQLANILHLEIARGYADKAVMGGLDRFLAGWASRFKSLLNDPGLCQQIDKLCSIRYAAMDQSGRRRWADKALAFLKSIDGTAAPALSPSIKAARVGKTDSTKSLSDPHGHSERSEESCNAQDRLREESSDPSLALRVTNKYPRSAPSPTAPTPPLDAPITTVRGINKRLAERFGRLGVETVRDMLYFFPRRHNDFSQVVPISRLEVGKEQTIVATVWEASAKQLGRRMKATEAVVGDETGNTRIVWFNQPYIAKLLRTNARVAISGRVSLFKGLKVFESPEWEFLDSSDLIHTGRLVPVYPLTEGLQPKVVRRLVKETMDSVAPSLPDFLPEDIRGRLGLIGLPEAIAQAHYPDNMARYDEARTRLAFDELFIMQLKLISRKREWQEARLGIALADEAGLAKRFLGSLPYSLTIAQKRVLNEIVKDLKAGRPMSRLLQGEVGSGKTVVATAAMLMAASCGYQAALMAPTEILAEQHFHTICGLLQGSEGGADDRASLRTFTSLGAKPVTVCLLIGGMKASEKRQLQESIVDGTVDLVIGTHALIQKDVEFSRLALAVVDEQHRFGVMQRGAIRQKGFNPHVLVMSATPIPRTLALTIYGDLEISTIDELPPGRQQITTKWVNPRQRQAAYDFLRQQVAAGRQAFIICPLIEESEVIETRAAVAEYERLSHEVFPDLRLGLLHGRMSTAEKEEVMRRFREGELHILVSTPVVEVGIDVPNATVMMVEGAERFGLSQLHQFRGRVGRGKHQSYCLLLSDAPSEEGQRRLAILEQTRDGFKLAEADLEMRGPGEFLGTRQSGLPDLRMARLSDIRIIEVARREASALLDIDLHLELPEHMPLALEVERHWKGSPGEVS